MSDLFDYERPEPHMTRTPDRQTSKKAARRINPAKPTIRHLVLEFAQRCPSGFTDEAMVKMRPDWAESSARKRRTELTEENYILDSGRTMKNTGGSEMTVWIHRRYHPNPPPIKPREAKPTRKQLEAEIKRLQGIIDSHGIGR